MSPSSTEEHLVYSVDTLRADLEAIREIAVGQFLHAGGWEHAPFDEWRTGQAVQWIVDESDPIRTKPTRSYEGVGKTDGAHEVFGELTFRLVGHTVRSSGGRLHKRPQIPNGLLVSQGSQYELKIFKGDRQLLARWVYDAAGRKHPAGPMLHVDVSFARFIERAIGGNGGSQIDSIPVPRLLSWVLTPGDAVDCLLSELFQEQWRERLGKSDVAPKKGVRSQRARLAKLLKEYADVAEGEGWQGIKWSRDFHRELV